MDSLEIFGKNVEYTEEVKIEAVVTTEKKDMFLEK